MIDNFALGLTHLLLAVGLWRVMLRPELDRDGAAPPSPPRVMREPRSRRRDG